MIVQRTVVIGGVIYVKGTEVPEGLIRDHKVTNPAVLGDFDVEFGDGDDGMADADAGAAAAREQIKSELAAEGATSLELGREQSVESIMAAVGEDKKLAEEALNAERAKEKPRVTLIRGLTEILNG